MRSLAAENEGNGEIQTAYAYGLHNLSNNQELLERKVTVGELRSLAAENEGNGDIQKAYAWGLYNLSNNQELLERKATVEEMRSLAAENEGNEDVQTAYVWGLYNLIITQVVQTIRIDFLYVFISFILCLSASIASFSAV